MSDTKLCPYCSGEIKLGAIKCKHCKSMLDRVESETKQEKIDDNVTEEKIYLLEGAEYIGQQKNGRPHGRGILTTLDGYKYEGDFKDGELHGQGTYTGKDGLVIKGRFKNGEFSGEFEFELADGIKYFGEVKDGQPHGNGTATWTNGSKYVGQWEDSKPHGQGTVTLLDGQKYVGEWKDGTPHGQGTMTYANGNIQKGKWEQGEYLGDLKNSTTKGKQNTTKGKTDIKVKENVAAKKQKKSKVALINTPSNWFAAEDENYHYICNTEKSYSIYKISRVEGEPVRLNEDESWYLNLSGDWLYYSNKSDKGHIYKAKKDGTERTKVCEDSASYLNIDNEWLYYCNNSDKNKIYKVKSDGSSRQCLSDSSAEYLNLNDGWLFYANVSDGGKIYKLKINGSKNVKLGDDRAKFLNVVGEWVYYSNDSKEGRLYKLHLNGAREFCVTDDGLRIYSQEDCFIIDENWVFYINGKDNYLYKCRADGTAKTRLNNQLTGNIIKHDGYIYYGFYKNISRVKLDGTGDQVIFETDGVTKGLTLFDNQLYYQNGSVVRNEGDHYIYKINLDGTGNTAVSSEPSKQFQLHDGWIYYSVEGEGGFPMPEERFCKVRLDGKKETTLFTEQSCYDFAVSANTIFYKSDSGVLKSFDIVDSTTQTVINASVGTYLVFGDQVILYAKKNHSYSNSILSASEQGKIYIINITDGQLRVLLNLNLKYDQSDIWNVCNDWLYYKDINGRVCKIRIDGSDNIRLTENAAVKLMIKDDWIYYVNSSDKHRLYRLDLDGSNRLELNSERSENIIVTEGHIYYAVADKDNRLFRIGLDGKGRKKVLDEEVAQINCLSDSIFYLNKSDSGKLYTGNLTGSTRKVVGIEESQITDSVSQRIVTSAGNSAGNINNYGFATIDENWIYYCDGNSLYKEHANGSSQKVLVDEQTSYLNIVDGWIYYASAENGNIYKMRTDGSGRNILNGSRSGYLNVVEDWIYYIDTGSKGVIKKIRTDGSEETKISDVRAKYLNYTEQWLVFLNLDDSTPKEASQAHELFGFREPGSGKIYKMKHDGSALSLVCPAETNIICTVEDWVYYICKYNNNAIYRANLNSDAVEKVSEHSARHLNSADNWVYFSDDRIARIRGDGTGYKVLYKNSAGLLNVVGEWIYFLESVDFFEGQVSRIRTDGSGYSPLHKRGKGAKHLRVKLEDGKSYIYRTFDRNIKLGSKVLVEGKKAGLAGEVIEEDAKYNKNADAQYISEVISYGTGSIDELSEEAQKGIHKYVTRKSTRNIVLEVKSEDKGKVETFYCKTKDIDIVEGSIVTYTLPWKRNEPRLGLVVKHNVKNVKVSSAFEFEIVYKHPIGSSYVSLLEDVREKQQLKKKQERKESAAKKKLVETALVKVQFDDNMCFSYINTDPKLDVGSIVKVTRAGFPFTGRVVKMKDEPKPRISYLYITEVVSYGKGEPNNS